MLEAQRGSYGARWRSDLRDLQCGPTHRVRAQSRSRDGVWGGQLLSNRRSKSVSAATPGASRTTRAPTSTAAIWACRRRWPVYHGDVNGGGVFASLIFNSDSNNQFRLVTSAVETTTRSDGSGRAGGGIADEEHESRRVCESRTAGANVRIESAADRLAVLPPEFGELRRRDLDGEHDRSHRSRTGARRRSTSIFAATRSDRVLRIPPAGRSPVRRGVQRRRHGFRGSGNSRAGIWRLCMFRTRSPSRTG